MKKPKPKRIQRKRTKGWRMPSNTVYVGRPSKWGNPLTKIKPQLYDRARAVILFKAYLTEEAKEKIRKELRGKNLCCWCPLDQPCHADILLEIANL